MARLGPGRGPGGRGQGGLGRAGREGREERPERERGGGGGGREKEGGEEDFVRGPRGRGEDFGPKLAQKKRRIIFRFFFLINFVNCFCCLINISGALKIQVKFEGSFLDQGEFNKNSPSHIRIFLVRILVFANFFSNF